MVNRMRRVCPHKLVSDLQGLSLGFEQGNAAVGQGNEVPDVFLPLERKYVGKMV